MRPLNDWTIEYALQLADEDERSRLELKATDKVWKGEGSTKIDRGFGKELGRQVSAFANYDGGMLVLGVAERTETEAARVSGKGLPTHLSGGTREWLRNKVADAVEPAVQAFDVGELVTEPGYAVYLVEVRPSEHAPHQSREDRRYYGRFGDQSKPMTHRQIVDVQGRRADPRLGLTLVVRRRWLRDDWYLDSWQMILEVANAGRVLAEKWEAYVQLPAGWQGVSSQGTSARVVPAPSAPNRTAVRVSGEAEYGFRPLFRGMRVAMEIGVTKGASLDEDIRAVRRVEVDWVADNAEGEQLSFLIGDMVDGTLMR